MVTTPVSDNAQHDSRILIRWMLAPGFRPSIGHFNWVFRLVSIEGGGRRLGSPAHSPPPSTLLSLQTARLADTPSPISGGSHADLTFVYEEDESAYRRAYCITAANDLGCNFGPCPNMDVTGLGQQISSEPHLLPTGQRVAHTAIPIAAVYITTLLYGFVLGYIPWLRRPMLYAHLSVLYSLLTAGTVSIAKQELTKADSIFVLICAASPTSIYLWYLTIRSFFDASFFPIERDNNRKTARLSWEVRITRFITLASFVYTISFLGITFVHSPKVRFSQPACNWTDIMGVNLLWALPVASQMVVIAILYHLSWGIHMLWTNLPSYTAPTPMLRGVGGGSGCEGLGNLLTNGEQIDLITWTETILNEQYPDFMNQTLVICILSIIQLSGLPAVAVWPLDSKDLGAWMVLTFGLFRHRPKHDTNWIKQYTIRAAISFLFAGYSVARCMYPFKYPLIPTSPDWVIFFVTCTAATWSRRTYAGSSMHIFLPIFLVLFGLLVLAANVGAFIMGESWSFVKPNDPFGSVYKYVSLNIASLSLWVISWLATSAWPFKRVLTRDNLVDKVFNRAHMLRCACFILGPHILWIYSSNNASPFRLNDMPFGQIFALIVAVVAICALLEEAKVVKRDVWVAFIRSDSMPLSLYRTKLSDRVHDAIIRLGNIKSRLGATTSGSVLRWRLVSELGCAKSDRQCEYGVLSRLSKNHHHAAQHWDIRNHQSDCAMEEEYIFTLQRTVRHACCKTNDNAKLNGAKEVEKQAALQETGPEIRHFSEESSRRIYGDIVNDQRASGYLKSNPSMYDMDRGIWTDLVKNPTSKEDLFGPLVRMMNSIIGHLGPSPREGIGRKAVDSHEAILVHDSGHHYSSPGVCIKARGPSFELPANVCLAGRPTELGYTNVASAIDVQLEKGKGVGEESFRRLSVYNRQIFIHQPNRNFARSLTVTEKSFQLVHYDRSGAYSTCPFDIHKEARLFIQYVLGLASLNEQDLGLDTSVQWTVNPTTGKKVAGTIKVEASGNENQPPTVYNLDMEEAPFVRLGICGRGTVGWYAKHPNTGEAVFIKDAWHTNSGLSECVSLRAASGIPGIVEMLSWQDNCADTVRYRPAGELTHGDSFKNLTKTRLVLGKHGTSIWFFKTRLQLLCALRDALIGHHALFKRGIIHRDISVLNVLLGHPDAPVGHRGFLIDLDMAGIVENYKCTLPADPFTGTRLYQSYFVLRGGSYYPPPPPPQDYMDELESFFYVLYHLMFGFKKPGILVPIEDRRFVYEWSGHDPSIAALGKGVLAYNPYMTTSIPPFWGTACVTLMQEFHDVMRDIRRAKIDIIGDRKTNSEEKLAAFDSLAARFDTYFEKVRDSFDKAIGELEKEGLNYEELEPYPSLLLPPHVSLPPSLAALAAADSRIAVASEEGASVRPSAIGQKRALQDDRDGAARKRARKL
ncbi:hypothetical protein NMY22_g1039 [Coprinellus aureogranulatus]|nr:hypothetical protein NMY22_g1039 [Coprinellus aureogranulatus]